MSFVKLEKDRLENLLIDAENSAALRLATAEKRVVDEDAKETARLNGMSWFAKIVEMFNASHMGYRSLRDFDRQAARYARLCAERDLISIRRLRTIMETEGNLTLSVETYQFLMRASDEQ